MSKLPCGIGDITPSLEYGYYLQYFNRSSMGMPVDYTTPLTKACGYVKAERQYPYPPVEEIMDILSEYPVVATFGGDVQAYLDMKRCDWVRVKRRAKQLPVRPTTDPLIQIRDTLKGLIDVYTKTDKASGSEPNRST